MNETIQADGRSDGPMPIGDHRVSVPDTSMLPGSEKAPPAAVKLLNRAVQGAHSTIDRVAGSAAPVARQLGEGVAAAEGAVLARTAQLRDSRDEWVENVRTTVRSNPLAAIAAAVALGALIARLTR